MDKNLKENLVKSVAVTEVILKLKGYPLGII